MIAFWFYGKICFLYVSQRMRSVSLTSLTDFTGELSDTSFELP